MTSALPAPPPAPLFADVTIGILAGGRGSRLGGRDKAWLCRGGMSQVLRWQRRLAGQGSAFLVNANRNLQRYQDCGLAVVQDRIADAGPLSGLDALASVSTTRWLMTLPVDLVEINDCLLRTLMHHAGESGAFAEDADDAQPLVALWPVTALQAAARRALDSTDFSVTSLQRVLAMKPVRFAGVRFGNLNTPQDLDNAGITDD